NARNVLAADQAAIISFPRPASNGFHTSKQKRRVGVLETREAIFRGPFQEGKALKRIPLASHGPSGSLFFSFFLCGNIKHRGFTSWWK
ncbi:MAG TPA: hypothetical protein PLS24_07605, partial [Sedimentisphaerales bacterium]|nr:hypothetical protein [Sedimentisphaerales bacterium]